jgi:UDP-2,3-diacylglucosamine pyrophosphatase LpxH
MAHYATLFLSDVHLGTRTCQAELLIDFLQRHDADTIYLVGDIVDFWRIRRGTAWPQSHDAVLQQILRKVRSGSRVVFIPGNHDEGLRDYCGTRFGGIEIVRDAVHETADGRRYLVMHGDEYDVVVRYARWLAFLGDRGYAAALALNMPLNWVRRQFGLGYWSLSAYLKHRVKTCVNHIGEFERALADAAKQRKVDGIICGHIHHAASRQIANVHYVNTGDWVESCTAIAETHAGELQLIRWLEVTAARERAAGEPSQLEIAA